jgi:hypothetical protein
LKLKIWNTQIWEQPKTRSGPQNIFAVRNVFGNGALTMENPEHDRPALERPDVVR